MIRHFQSILSIIIATLLICCHADHNSNKEKLGNHSLSTADSLRIIDSLTHIKNIPAVTNDKLFEKDLLPFLDTTIFIDLTSAVMYDSTMIPPLTLSKSKSLLYKYYKTKDFYIDGNIPPMEIYEKLPTYNNKGEYRLDVFFDTATFVSLNSDKNYDAIILYEMYPPYACGHCLGRPNKAVILSNGDHYVLAGIDFIPDSYVFDSIKQVSKNMVFIYGYDYDCPNFKLDRHFKITLTGK